MTGEFSASRRGRKSARASVRNSTRNFQESPGVVPAQLNRKRAPASAENRCPLLVAVHPARLAILFHQVLREVGIVGLLRLVHEVGGHQPELLGGGEVEARARKLQAMRSFASQIV